MQAISFKHHRFPPEFIRHAAWLYARFTLSEARFGMDAWTGGAVPDLQDCTVSAGTVPDTFESRWGRQFFSTARYPGTPVPVQPNPVEASSNTTAPSATVAAPTAPCSRRFTVVSARAVHTSGIAISADRAVMPASEPSPNSNT